MKSESPPVKSERGEDAFFAPRGGGVYAASAHTAGPWDAGLQHAGPPAALLMRELLAVAPDGSFPARVTFELLGPIPVDDVAVRAQIARPGRSVTLIEATMAARGRDVVRASAWLLTPTDRGLAPDPYVAPPLPPGDTPVPPLGRRSGYFAAMRWRFVSGGFGVPGPATVWGAMRIPLVPGEQPDALARTLVFADSASGVSSVVDTEEWLFINPELTIHLHRRPVGEWIGLDAETLIGANGAGLATATLFDSEGGFGRSAQSLLVRPR